MIEYERLFGKFRYSVTGIEWFQDQKELIEKSYRFPTASLTYRIHKKRIYDKWRAVYDKFLEYVRILGKKPSVDELDDVVTWYHTKCIDDPELFAINYCLADNGLPPFPTEWQSELMEAVESGDYQKIYGLMSRRMGKTTDLQILVPHRMAKYPNKRDFDHVVEHIQIFAPRQKQLKVMKDIYNSIMRSTFLKEEFVMEKNDDPAHKGKLNNEYILFGRNWCDVEASNLSQNATGGREGRSATGKGGTFFVVDEWGQVIKTVLKVAVKPLGADAFSQKQFLGFGTPTTAINPDLDQTWNTLKKDPAVKTFTYNWVDGIRMGNIQRSYMKSIFNDEDYNIPCPFGQTYGVCAREQLSEEVRFDEERLKRGEPPLVYPRDEGYEDAWKCNECCYFDNEFVEEYWADFADRGSGYWDMDKFSECANEDMRFYKHPWQGITKECFLAVDFGALMYPTQAVLGEMVNGTMKVRKHIEIHPLSKSDKREVGKTAGRPILEKIHEEFDEFKPYIKTYFFDLTGDKMKYLSNDIVNGFKTEDGTKIDGFPLSKIFRTKTAEKNGVAGLWIQYMNKDFKNNLRRQINMGRVQWPKRNPFVSTLEWEMKNCIVQRKSGGHIKFDHPKFGRQTIDLLDAMSFLVWPMSHIYKKGGTCNTTVVAEGGRTHVIK